MATIQYVFAEDETVVIKGGAAKADPQAIGEELERIRLLEGGELHPQRVLIEASEETNPLHRYFEWSDAKAAHNYRLDQARAIIRIIRVVEPDDTPRLFYSINGPHGTSYRTITDVRKSRDLQGMLLDQADRDLAAFNKRYDSLKDVCGVVVLAREAIARRKEKAKPPEPEQPAPH